MEGSRRDAEARESLTYNLRKCALGRRELRGSVRLAMDAGLSKEDIIGIIREAGRKNYTDASLCSIIATGEAMRYEVTHPDGRSAQASLPERTIREFEFRESMQRCVDARDDLRASVIRILDTGLTKERVLSLIDEIVGGLARDDFSLCGILAAEQILSHEETRRREPIDILAEARYQY